MLATTNQTARQPGALTRRPVKSVYAILQIAGSMSRNFTRGGGGGRTFKILKKFSPRQSRDQESEEAGGLALSQLKKGLDKAFRMERAFLDFLRVQFRQNLEALRSFMVAAF